MSADRFCRCGHPEDAHSDAGCHVIKEIDGLGEEPCDCEGLEPEPTDRIKDSEKEPS